MKFLTCLVTLFVTALSQTTALAQGQNKIIVDPSYLQRHVSERKLTFTVPKDWQVDEEAAAKLGMYAVILPKGVKIENADRLILIGFQYNDPESPGTATLANYQKANFDRTRAQFPEVQANKWRPSGLDPSKIDYISVEYVSSYGLEFKDLKSNNEMTISHVLIITNARTKTFYFCLFESVESKWKEAWKIGEQIVQTLILNDDI
jgi:hypothetical protein